MSQVTFPNTDFQMAGVLFKPKNFDESKKYPAFVVGHPGGSCKDQSPANYAKALCEHGYVILTYDAAHHGESGGEPRFVERPLDRVHDFVVALDYLSTLKYVDTDRLGLLGICASGFYSLSATMNDRRVKALATVSAAEIGPALTLTWDGQGSLKERAAGTLGAIADTRRSQAVGGDIVYVSYSPDSAESAPHPELAEAYEYYKTPRAQHKNAPGTLRLDSLAECIQWDGAARVGELLTVPTLFVRGDKAASRWHVDQLIPKLTSKYETVDIPGASHFDMYDKRVDDAAPYIADFFKKYL